MPPSQIISTPEFDALIAQAAGPLLVEFYSESCGPCQAMSQTLDALAVERPDHFKLLKLAAADHRDLCLRYHLSAVPTTLFFHRGKLVDQIRGLAAKSVILRRLDALSAGRAA